ncbi:tellurite resistance TerB C-terminal domain-containing protein [Burkholderia sp. Ac-20365]|uniref:tellurite resistance TerB C-terminal domain-containing protein n=1 Tax=Burkholderia sp. Ac-20365 TaxID=2703897 RepID=UPI001F11BF90|nr:tellurite resistance TerB C-terminal domain-containing protein [Burkholderia sp. Ac-20365]
MSTPETLSVLMRDDVPMNTYGHAMLLLDLLYLENLLPECSVDVRPQEHPERGAIFVPGEDITLGRSAEEVTTAIWKLVVCWRKFGYLDLEDPEADGSSTHVTMQQETRSDEPDLAASGMSVSAIPATDRHPEDVGSTIKTPGVILDARRLAALKEETARVSSMLAEVFAEERPNAMSPIQARRPDPDVARISEQHPPARDVAALFPCLDEPHCSFLRLLVTRALWTRAELIGIVAPLDLMLDGAIEQINEAALDLWDEPVADGDDPIEITHSIVQRLAA